MLTLKCSKYKLSNSATQQLSNSATQQLSKIELFFVKELDFQNTKAF